VVKEEKQLRLIRYGKNESMQYMKQMDAYKEGKLLIWENGVKKYNPSSKKMGHFV